MLAVEDYCALKPSDPVNKYKGTLEDLAKFTSTYVPRAAFKDAARRLYTLILLNYAVRNADAHLKNFALVYTSVDDVRLAPVYDVLSSTVYPKYSTQLPALPLQGKRVWGAGSMLAIYGGTRLGLSKADMDEARERVANAMRKVAPMVAEYAQRYPGFREVAKSMLDAWGSGLEDIRPDAKPGKTATASLRELAGMSGSDPAVARRRRKP